MEDVDRMIVDNLVNDLQCSFAGKVSKLGDFDSAQLVEGIIRCIWRCRPASVATFPSYHLPTNPIERFRLASQISREIQTIGIRDQQQIGYHALLYPNVFDSRHIFLALFEHFPKEFVRPTMAEDQLSPTEKLKANVGAIIADQLKSKWKPEFCRFYDLQRIGRLWFPPPNATRDHHIFDAKMEEQSDFMTTTTCMEQKQPKIQNCKAAPQIAPKPRLSSKPLPLSPVSPFRDEIAANAFAKPILVPSSTHDVDEAKWQCAHEKVVQKRILLTQKRQTLAALHHANALLAEQCSARKHHQIGGGGDERLVQLLDEPEENLQKLEHYIACANSRRGALEQKFVDAERQRLSLLDDAALDGGRRRRTDAAEAGNNGVKVETEATTTAHPLTHRGGPKQAEELDCTIGALEQLLDQRQRIRQKLLRECQKVGENSVENGDGRANYVQRILEMSAMVGKQNEEIRRTAKSVQNLRKEIEQLMGSLGRTFIAVNRWLSKDAEDNARMQRAYKLMVRTHEQCSLVMTCIEDQGQLSRHTDELIDKINIEQQKSVDEQLEKLLDDLMVINHENTELEKRFTHFSLKHVVE